jgi:hypothetical protein
MRFLRGLESFVANIEHRVSNSIVAEFGAAFSRQAQKKTSVILSEGKDLCIFVPRAKYIDPSLRSG